MISSVVLRLDSEAACARAVAELADHPQLELGQPVDDRHLPLAIQADDSQQLEQLHNWLRDRPGVVLVDVVCVFFDDASQPAHESEVQR